MNLKPQEKKPFLPAKRINTNYPPEQGFRFKALQKPIQSENKSYVSRYGQQIIRKRDSKAQEKLKFVAKKIESKEKKSNLGLQLRTCFSPEIKPNVSEKQ